MKITRRQGVGTPEIAPGIQPGGGLEGRGESAQAAQAGDSVSLSEEARLLNRAKKETGSIESRSGERVAELRKAVEEGKFRPEPTAVAKSFLREILAYFVR